MVRLIKETFALIVMLLSISTVLAESGQWIHNDQSQVAEDASPGLSSFLEHVLKAQDEINWVKRVAQHEKGATKEQCVQLNSKPFPTSDNLERFDSDRDDHSDTPVQNIEGNEWGLGSRGENLVSDFMYDSDQNQFKSKNAGERFKRRSSNQLYKDPELKEIVRNNIDNLHMLNFSPEQDTDIHMIAETSDIDSEDNTSIERRGTGKADSSEEARNVEDDARKKDPSDSVAEAYFAAHGKRQASRGRSVSEAHNRGVRVDVADPLSEAELLKTINERSEREHQRLQLEDADGLLKGTRIDTHIGSIDTQMALDKEKTSKQPNKVKFRTVPIKESKITSRDSQSQDSGLPQQIKLDLLNDPLYNKVDLKTASQIVNIGIEKNEKNLIAGNSALEPNLLSSVHQYLAGFDQQQQESPSKGAPELEGAQIFLNKKDTSGQQVKWDEAALTPQLSMPAQGFSDKIYVAKDSDLPVVPDTYSNTGSKDMRLLRLTRSNHEQISDISGDTLLPASKHSSSESQNQLGQTDRDAYQSSRGKRTAVKRPGAIWREVAGNEDLVGSEDEDMSQDESDAESEGKGAISFESEENDVDDSVSSAGNGGPSKSSSEEEEDSAVGESEETIEEANGRKSDENKDRTNNISLDQDLENSHSDDAARLKASFKFSSKYAPHLEANSFQDAEDTEETSYLENSNFVRSERAIKKTHQSVETGEKLEEKENKIFAGKTHDDDLDQGHKTKNSHLDDAARLKASFKFSSKYASPQEANNNQNAEDPHKTSNSDNSHFVRNKREIERSHRAFETSAGGLERVIDSDEDAELKLDRNKNVRKSCGLDALDPNDDMLEDTVNSKFCRERKENLLPMAKTHSSRSLLSLFEPLNIIQDFKNQINSSPLIEKHSFQEEEKVAGYSSEPLSKIIDRELLSGNLPPLVRVKRSASEAVSGSTRKKKSYSPESVDVDGKQSSLGEKPVKQGAVDWESACANMKQPTFDEKQTVHGNAKRFAVEQSAKGKAILSLNVKQSDVYNTLDKQGFGNQESVCENVKRSPDEADLLGDPAEDSDFDQKAIFEQLWNSGSVRAKRGRVHAKRNHGRAKAPTARDASNKVMSGEKGSEKYSHVEKSEWKISIRSTKHARRNNEDEDEKEYESDDLNICPKNATKRATELLGLRELDSGDKIASEMEDVNINFPINGQVDETEDESEYEYSQNKQDKDYDVVRRHVQHSYKKRHPANKDNGQALVTNIEEKANSDESRVEDESTRNVFKQEDSKEEKEGRAIKILSEDRHKRATDYDGIDIGKVKSDSLSMPSLSNNNMGNINLKRNSKSLLNSNLNSPYENIKKLENPPAVLNSPLIPGSKIINQHSPDPHTVDSKLSGSSKDKAVQGLAFPRSDLHEIHEMRLAGTKLSDSPAFGTDLTSSISYSDSNSGDMTFLAPNVNERALDQRVRCAEMATASPSSPDASMASSAKPICSTGRPAMDDQTQAERRTDRRRGIVNTPLPNQSDEYNGELDDGHLGTEIVQAIFQQVDKTPCFKQSFGSGLSLRYHPTDIKETKEYNCHSQQMMHQIMQLIDQSVDEEVKSRTCSSLPSDLEEFMTWLMRNDTQLVSSTENPFFFGSQCAKAPTPRHLEEPKAEDIERQISLRNKLICEYKKLEKCDQDEVKPIYEYLSEQKNFLTRLLQKSKSKSGCDKKLECTKKPGCDSDLEQQRLVEETMDSVGLGPNAMHSSNIGDKFISGLSMIDESSEQLSDADGASVARRSVPKESRLNAQRSYYDRRFLPDARGSPDLSCRPVRDAEDESSHEGHLQNCRHYSDDNEYDERVVDNVELRRKLKRLNRYKDSPNRHRSLKEAGFVPSIKYKRLVARVAELKRRKRNASRRKKPIG